MEIKIKTIMDPEDIIAAKNAEIENLKDKIKHINKALLNFRKSYQENRFSKPISSIIEDLIKLTKEGE